jgi:hypothetical protein
VLLDRRLAMEAARMLVHSLASMAEVGHTLGFSKPTNFIRFLVRLAGATPLSFRGRYTGDQDPGALIGHNPRVRAGVHKGKRSLRGRHLLDPAAGPLSQGVPSDRRQCQLVASSTAAVHFTAR